MHREIVVVFVGDDDLVAIGGELDAFGFQAAGDLGDFPAGLEVDDRNPRRLLLVVGALLLEFHGFLRARLGRRAAGGGRFEGDEGLVAAHADEFGVLADLNAPDDFAGRQVDYGEVALVARRDHQQPAVGGDAQAARRGAADVDFADGFETVQIDGGDIALLVADIGDAAGGNSRQCEDQA